MANTTFSGPVRSLNGFISFITKAFILGSGGVVPSIILALKRLGASKIFLSNRTKKKAEELKKSFSDLELIDWGKIPEFHMIVNATSIGLKEGDEIDWQDGQGGMLQVRIEAIEYQPERAGEYHR